MPTAPDSVSDITYQIHVNDSKTYTYQFTDKNGLLSFINNSKTDDLSWAKLEHHQCPNCPLNSKEVEYCPIAENFGGILKDWNNEKSFSSVELTVNSNNRVINASTSAQKALGSLLGLIIATSNCPYTQFFRPMAQFHLPLASSSETSYRAISTYLLTLFFRKQAGEDIDFNLTGLSKIYENMHELNIYIKKRLVDAVEQDAALNAVMVLDIFTINSTNFLDEELQELKKYFSIL